MSTLSRLISCILSNQKSGAKEIIYTFEQINNCKKSIYNSDSNTIKNFLQILEKEGFIRSFSIFNKNYKNSKSKTFIIIYLKYDTIGNPAIHNIKQISTNGLRKYISVNSLWQPQTTTGVYIISTVSGYLTDIEARQKNLGGEIICSII